ncbi:hypothetical protein [Methanolapillus ohkumae]|uniref:Uncharacterized protein n=1 Tax=Methanolapillus ohkumae TaxID=3028298 RepID=A0AA96V4M9_9EURY|nr:hypothetical protein MsAm2_02210 [Methanosarcinaceae archaeon Am2]
MSQNSENRNQKENSKENQNFKKEKNSKKVKESEDKNKLGKVNFRLSKELKSRIKSERKPDEIVSAALLEYYAGNRRREENIIQREIDNSIIEVQRRHISDLKEQLAASNKNYEELMKIHQAYMLQVQPLIENAKRPEIDAAKPGYYPMEQKSAPPEPEEENKNSEGESENSNKKPDAEPFENLPGEPKKMTAPILENKKKWYQFWK